MILCVKFYQKCLICKHRYATLCVVDKYCHPETFIDGVCPNRTPDGHCKGADICDETTRNCWCENFEEEVNE